MTPSIAFSLLTTHANYVAAVILLAVGAYTMAASPNLVKKVIGMTVFQAAIFLIFITAAFVDGGAPPIMSGDATMVSPLPHVLVLTAIVVGVSLTAVALALIVRIYREYGTLEEAVLREKMADER